MNFTMVGALMKKAAGFLPKRELRPVDFTALHTLVFRCRAPGTSKTSISLRRLAKTMGVCKDTVIDAIGRLEGVGLIRKTKRRVRIKWGLGIASRQATNVYEFLPPTTGSIPSPVIGVQETSITVVDPESRLERALARLRLDQPVDFPH